MNKQFSKAERTRSFIIESTAEIFNKKGYAGTSLSDLTEATGLTKGSIYGNFENKEEVALAVFDYNQSRITQQVRAQVDAALSYQEKLLVYASFYKTLIQGGALDQGGCPILNTAVEADDTNSLLRERAAKAIANWKNALSQLIEAGMANGEFKQGIPVRQLSLSIIALIEGAIMIAQVTSDPTNMDTIMDSLEGMISQMKV